LTSRAAYLRFAVSNPPGRVAAEDVEVLLQRVERLSVLGELLEEPSSYVDRVQIGFPAFGWTNVPTTALTIPPGVSRVIDLAIFSEPVGEPPPSASPSPERVERLRLAITTAPNDQRHLLTPGRYKLSLVISARNADARYYETEIDFDGEWPEEDAAVWDHLRVVSPPRRVRYPASVAPAWKRALAKPGGWLGR